MVSIVPTSAEQYKSEFKLKENLEWFQENGATASKVSLGANDVAIDERGVPIADKKLGELGLGKNSEELGIGAETVKTLISRSYSKLGVTRRAEAIA